ncbi:MAG: sodium:solute symporter [Burkholderiales bacterium]|jgi:SSS family solute:Na+ symporter|nr:sodium:solute symporter [Burkholderiales bacterium]
MLIKLMILVAFFTIIVTIGLYCRKHAVDVNSFVLGGRKLGPWMTAFAYGTTYFSAVMLVGYSGQFGWRFGVSSTWIGIGCAVIGSLLSWAVLARRTRIMTQHLGSATMPDFFGSRYNSKPLKLVASAIVFIFLIPYTASLYNGLSRVFTMAFDIDFAIVIVIMAVMTGVYVSAGGYVATAVNDFIQGTIMLIGVIVLIGAVLNTNGGLMSSMDALARVSDPAVSDSPGVFTSFLGPDPINLLGVLILVSLGTWGLPQMIQKFYAIKSEKQIAKGTIISTIFAIVIAGGGFFMGGFGRLFADSAAYRPDGSVIYDSIVPGMLSGYSDLLMGVMILLILAASMSTLASLVMTSASTLTIDFIQGIVEKAMDEKRKVLVIRLLIVVFVIISSVIAIFQYNHSVVFIAQLMGVSWGALAGSFIAPYLYGLYWKRTTRIAVWCSMAFGTLFNTAVFLTAVSVLPKSLLPELLRSPINAGAFTLLFGLVLVPVVSLLTPKPNKEYVDKCFSCYDEDTVITKDTLVVK